MPQLPPDADFIPDFSKGLVPAIAQDCASGEVLMLAYMNEDAWRKTLETGEAHYWSRSRRELWAQGRHLRHVQKVRALRLDCDNDTVLLLVEQRGGATPATRGALLLLPGMEDGRLREYARRSLTPKSLWRIRKTSP